MAVKYYIGNKGWTGKTVHAIRVEEDQGGVIIGWNGTNENLCYRWETTVRPITNLRKVEASESNVTCSKCLKRLARRRAASPTVATNVTDKETI